ncbi:MAG: sigma-70 family RNA polymerase sigma factor [Verrucomicrobiales bacterium]|nr:sigma-70 family RNA polymerase sigma factor [Verrucomicrobiales bacterium]
MDPDLSADRELVGCYAREGSEAAFRALVSRHVNLVFGAALRQTGDPGIAEEITQNVFVALAQKAPRLAGHETLAGWLHRTAILEAKSRLRSELRRQRREDTAAALAQIQSAGTSPAEDLSPVLDEGLLQLREPDRLALILRYLEERSLRDVGRALGIEEDAARKRVDRALIRLAGFFRSQGFAVPAGAGAAVLAQSSTVAAPVGLAAAASQAGLAAGTAGTGLASLLTVSLMKLSSLQTAGLCALVVAAPLAWQWNQHRELRVRESLAFAAASASAQEREDLSGRIGRLRSELDDARAQSAESRTGPGARPSVARSAAADVYRWDDQSPVVRVPKDLLKRISIPAVTSRRGELTEQIRVALQMNDTEAATVQASMDRMLEGVRAAEAAGMKPVAPSSADLDGRAPEDVRVFEVSGDAEVISKLRKDMLAEVRQALGTDRSEIFQQALGSWIPMENEGEGGVNSGWAFLQGDHRIQVYNTSGEADGRIIWLRWGATTSTGSRFTSTIGIDEIPGYLQPHLQDWIAGAQAAAAASRAAAIRNP